MNGVRSGGVFSTRNVIIIACVALIVLLGAAAIVVAVMGNTGDMAAREDIEARLEELGTEDLGHKYVAAHLLEYGIGGFDAGKIRRIEFYFNQQYPMELPSVPEIAYKTAELFMSAFYDRVDHSDKEELTTALLHCYTEATGDKYAVYRTAEELESFDEDMSGTATFVGIGVEVIQTIDPATDKLKEVLVDGVRNGSGADDAGILPLDYIIAVDGVPIEEFDNQSLINAIRGEVGTKVAITVLRGEEELTLECERRMVEDITVECSIADGIGYIEITSFKSNTPELFAAALAEVRTAEVEGIIFDLRNNRGGYLDAVLDMMDMLVPSGVRLASYVGADGSETVFNSTGRGALPGVPVVVICNEKTASAGELFTAALRDYAAMGLMTVKTVGKTTYGKGIMQSTYTLYDGSSITLTTAFYNPPSNVNYNGVGIKPDVEVDQPQRPLTDVQLDRAYEELGKMISGTPSGDQNSNL